MAPPAGRIHPLASPQIECESGRIARRQNFLTSNFMDVSIPRPYGAAQSLATTLLWSAFEWNYICRSEPAELATAWMQDVPISILFGDGSLPQELVSSG